VRRASRRLRASLLAIVALSCATNQRENDVGSVSQALTWVEAQELASTDELTNQWLGASVALTSDSAFLGAPAAGAGQGAVHVFERSGSRFVASQVLKASDAVSRAYFGRAIAVSGDMAVIGAPGDFETRGAAYVFVRSGSSWTEVNKLEASDGATADLFGHRTAVSNAAPGATLVIGAPGASGRRGHLYVYERSGSTWTEQRLVAANSLAGDSVGLSLAFQGDTLLAGATFADESRGVVHAFVRSGSTWNEQPRLDASDGLQYDRFGVSIALDGDTAVIGADHAKIGAHVGQGAAYVFERSGASFREVEKLWVPDGVQEEAFASSLALFGDTAIIGSPISEVGVNPFQGMARVFRRAATGFEATQELWDVGGEIGGGFANAIALHGGTALIGSPRFQAPERRGSAFVFSLRGDLAETCALDAECVSGHCADGRCCDQPCDGECDACAVAFGALANGTCSSVPAGSLGAPACAAPLGCTGRSSGCTACEADSDCAIGSYCGADAGCHPQKAAGERCDLGALADCRQDGCAACATGFCADGVCCNVACGGCRACAMVITGEPDGSCAPVPDGADPKQVCPADRNYPAACGADGDCDGRGACRAFARAGTPCGETTCSAGTVTGLVCSSVGRCEERSVPCAPYACDDNACADACDVEGCTDDAYCLGDVCADKKEDGGACSDGRECQNGHCSRNRCCNSACNGECEGCDEPGTEGTCVPLRTSECLPRPRCIDERTAISAQGETTMDCTPYECSPVSGVCAKSCTTSTECVTGFVCNPETQTCVSAGSQPLVEEGGCACRAPAGQGSTRSSGWWTGLLLFGLLSRARRVGARSRLRSHRNQCLGSGTRCRPGSELS